MLQPAENSFGKKETEQEAELAKGMNYRWGRMQFTKYLTCMTKKALDITCY